MSENARNDPQRVAVMYERASLSYRDLDHQAIAFAKGLLALGTRRGDRIGLLMGNRPEWLIACFGIVAIGGVLVPINTWYRRAELGWILRTSGISVLVSASGFLGHDYAGDITALVPDLGRSSPGALRSGDIPQLRASIFIDHAPAGALNWQELIAAGAAITDDALNASRAMVHPGDLAYILYTSGSTAQPKAVGLRHQGLIANGFDTGERRLYNADDRVWLGLPLFYGGAAANALTSALTHGASLVLQDHFDAATAISAIRSSRATIYHGVGNMTRAILDHPTYARSKVGTLEKGVAGTSARDKYWALVEVGVHHATTSYGLTESYGSATCGMPDEPLDVKLRTSGAPLPGFDVRIADVETLRPIRTGQIGLILLRGHVTDYYVDDPAGTTDAFTPEGFFITGDLGSLDEVGCLIVHGRMKDVVRTGGISVSAPEVEQLLMRHAQIREVHVVGVPDERKGEIVVAFVERVGDVTEDELRDFVRETAASFKVPHRIIFRASVDLPRGPSGKVAKHELRLEALRELGLSP